MRATSAVVGIHLTDVPFVHAFRPPNDLTDAERKYLEHFAALEEPELLAHEIREFFRPFR